MKAGRKKEVILLTVMSLVLAFGVLVGGVLTIIQGVGLWGVVIVGTGLATGVSSIIGFKRLSAIVSPDRVPPVAEFVLALLAKREERYAILGDAEEHYRLDVAKFGPRRARRFYWSDVLRSLAPLAWTALKRGGFVAAVAGFAWRWLKS